MELSMSGGALRTFTRCVACLARVGSDVDLQAHPAKLEPHTLNGSRSAYASVSLARDFFDHFHLSASAATAPSSTPLQCSILLKSVLRTPAAALDRLAASLPHPDAPKLQLTLHCLNGCRLCGSFDAFSRAVLSRGEEDVLDRVQRGARGVDAGARPRPLPQPPRHPASGPRAPALQLPVLAAGAHRYCHRACCRAA